MNIDLIHEYLQRTAKPVQLVKHFDEVIDKHKVYPLAAQQKHDGVYCLAIVLGGVIKLYGRTGLKFYWEADEVIKLDGNDPFKQHRPQPVLADGVYIGEFCNTYYTLEQLSGYLNPNRKKPWTEEESTQMLSQSSVYFHDYLTFDELLGGHSERPYIDRHQLLSELLYKANLDQYIIGYDLVWSEDEAQAYADRHIERGHEGAVFKRLDADWVAGHKGYRAMKIVRGVSLDLLCTGVVFGKGKRDGQIAALEFSYKGSTFKADLGKGWTDDRRNNLTKAHLAFESGKTKDPICTPVGCIYEVKALDISSTGKALRLPKVVRVRWDKAEPDS